MNLANSNFNFRLEITEQEGLTHSFPPKTLNSGFIFLGEQNLLPHTKIQMRHFETGLIEDYWIVNVLSKSIKEFNGETTIVVSLIVSKEENFE